MAAAAEQPESTLTSLWSVGRFHIVAIAALGMLTFGWVFTGEWFVGLAGLCALDWFLVNLLNRVVDLEEDRANQIAGTDFVDRNKVAIFRTGLALLTASFVVTAVLAPILIPIRAAFHALGFAYNWPLFKRAPRIKALYFWKNTASATGFMLTVFGFPVAMVWSGLAALEPDVTWLTVMMGAGFFFLFELSYEVVYDLRDAPGDRAAGVKTYPAVHGEAVSVRIIDGLLLGSLLFLVVGYAMGAVPWRLFVMVLAPVLQWVLYRRWVKRGVDSDDCITITWIGAGLLAAYHVWILAGLPLTVSF